MNRREALKRTALLLGAAASPSTLARAMAELSAPATSAPHHLPPGLYAVATALVDRLLPATDTPGAIAAGVPQFIDVSFGLFMTEADQIKFRTGLQTLASAGFADLPGTSQDKRILAIAESDTAPGQEWLRHFRWLSFHGYFTSEAAAKSGFKWDPVPGPFLGCVPLADTDGAAYFEMR